MGKFQLFVSISLLFLFLWYRPSIVLAHVLKTDGNIGAIMHTDPDDNPLAGSKTGIFFEFKDTQAKLSPENCNCTFSISENDKEIYSQPLFQNNPSPSLDNSSVFFFFPEKNVYQIKVIGKPNSVSSFQPFTLVYDVTVGKDAPDYTPKSLATKSAVSNVADNSTTNSSTQPLTYLGVGLGVVIVLIYLRRR